MSATVVPLADVVAGCFTAAGGGVEPGGPEGLSGCADIDIAVGGRPRGATTVARLVAGLILEQSLPVLVSDVRVVPGRFQTLHGGRQAPAKATGSDDL